MEYVKKDMERDSNDETSKLIKAFEVCTSPEGFLPRLIYRDNVKRKVYLKQGLFFNKLLAARYWIGGNSVSFEEPYHLFEMPDGKDNMLRSVECAEQFARGIDYRRIFSTR